MSRRSAKAGRAARRRDRHASPIIRSRGDRDRDRPRAVARPRRASTLWRVTFRSSPPTAFTKDLMARFLCWHIQEQAQGGLDPETAKHLDGLARGDKRGAKRPRRLKLGTVLLREYQGERHTVTVVANGYVWYETTYASLSTIARASPARVGTDRASLGYIAARSQGLRRKRQHQTTSDVLFGKSHPAGAAQSPLVGDWERRP